MALILELQTLADMVETGASLTEMAAAVGWTEKYVQWVIGTDGFKLILKGGAAAPSSPGSGESE